MEPVLLNDFKRQWAATRVDVLAAVERVGSSGWYILGEAVEQFEGELARSTGSAFALGCASGLDAIEIALRALALPRGARVLTTPLSAFATTLAIVRAGCSPVFVDVDERGHLDLSLCDRLLAKDRSIACLLPVHLYGHPLDLEHLASLKERTGVRIIEDCAQSIGASWNGRAAGTVGEMATLSFYPTKNLGAIGDAGAVLGSVASLRDDCRALRNYGQSSRYVHDRLGLNSRLDELQAAILHGAFWPRLEGWTARRRAIAARYVAELSNSRVRLLTPAAAAQPVWHLFPVVVAADERQALQEHLRAAGIQSAVHYPALIPEQDALRGTRYEVCGDLSRARALAAGEVSLPMHPYLTDHEVDRVVSAVNAWRGP